MRYIKLYFSLARSSLMSKLVYKANVIIGIIAFLLAETTSLLTLYLLVRSIPAIDGYGIYQLGLLFGLTNMAIGIDHLLTDRLWNVAYFEVRLGKMDHLFLRPVPILFQVIASEVQLEAIGELIVAIALICFCGPRASVSGSAAAVIPMIIGIICAAIIISSFKVLVASLAFKFKRSGPLLQFIYSFAGYAKYPLRIYPQAMRFIMTFIIPLGFCLFYPYENLFSISFDPILLSALMISVTSAFATVCVLVWSRMVRTYESTGS